MISKKLLSEVLNIENERISRTVDKFCFPNTNTIAVQYYMTDGWQHINIYELAHKCKEYARSYDYYIESVVFEYGSRAFVHRKYVEYPLQILVDKNEPAVIFKAAEYIMQDLK